VRFRAIRVEIRGIDEVVVGRLVADREREVPGGAALGSAEADEQLEVVGILAKDSFDLVDVRGLRSAFRAEVGGGRRAGESQRGEESRAAREDQCAL